MATEERVHAAHEVADAFVKQYFQILRHMPHEARRLYVDASVVSRPGPDGTTMMSFNSIEAINEQFLSCVYEGTTFDVLSVDSQNLSEDGVFVMIIGFLTGKNNLKRRFSQMFYLARPQGVDGAVSASYVVLNDIFRFVDEEASAPITHPIFESVPETETAKPDGELNKTELIHKTDVNAAEVKNGVSEESLSLDNGQTEHCNEKVVTAQNPVESVVETIAPTKNDGAKRSFAAIVQSMARNAAPFQVKTPPVQKPKYMGQPRAAAAPHQAHAFVSNYEKRNEHKIVDEPGTSIFVANLPTNAMPPQLHELFKEFGPIKENGIQIRSSRANGVCFGFVAFESATTVQSVLRAAKNNPFVLEDHKLRVKEKQVDCNGSKPSGGRSGGGSSTQNGSADGGDEFIRRNRNRRNSGRTERREDNNANGDDNQKSNEGGAHEVQA